MFRLLPNFWQCHRLHCNQHGNSIAERVRKHSDFVAGILDAVKNEYQQWASIDKENTRIKWI